jgi:homocysteine S-methyltransferase
VVSRSYPDHVTTIRDELVRRPLLLDGGLSTTLEALGHDISGELWSARLLKDEPAAVVAAHRAFFDAGSDVATTATYQATFDGFAQRCIDRDETASLMRRGVQLARQAAESIERPTWVAASAGPYGAMLADGSEYHGRYGLTVDELRLFHRERFEVLAGTGADVVAFETLPCAAEVEAVLAEVAGSGVDCWVSLSIDGEVTRAGEPLVEVLAMAADVDEVIAVGVNCSTPSDATAAVAHAAATGRPAVVYPNSGEGWDAVRRAWVPADSAPHFPVEQWIADGARLVGGCCRVTPSDIAAMAAQLAR